MNETGVARLPLWVDDFLIACQISGEPLEVTGARVKLWCLAFHQQNPGTLPDDDVMLARLSGATPRQWKRIKPWLAKSWSKTEDGQYFIRRVAEEAERVRAIQAQNRAAANKRWGGNAGAYANAIPPPAPAPAPAPALSGFSPTPTLGGPPDAESRSLRASAPADPKPKPKTPNLGPMPEVSEDQAERIDQLRLRLHAVDRRGSGRLDRLVSGYLGRGSPPEVLIGALESAVEHRARDPEAYVAKILRVDEPNFHEAASIAKSRADSEPMSFAQVFGGTNSREAENDRRERTRSVEPRDIPGDTEDLADAG